MKKKILSIVLALLIAACCAAPARGATVLEVGSRGSDVIKVQNRLIQWGYLNGTADGRYGEATRNAVLRFQRNNGLTADGRVGASTAAAMGVTLSGSSSSSSAATTASSSTAPSTVNSLPRMHFMGWAARNSSQNSTSLMFFPSYQAGQPP